VVKDDEIIVEEENRKVKPIQGGKSYLQENEAVTPSPNTASTDDSRYTSLIAPTQMTDDAMSGWRTELKTINQKYGGDILNYDSTKPFQDSNDAERNQYYNDRRNYETLYNTISNYDNEWMAQQKALQRAEEYANTRKALLERYLPETLAAMGYANTGLSSDAMIKLNNSYENYALDAQEKVAQNQADILAKYQQSITDVKQGQGDEQKANYDAYLAGLFKDGVIDFDQVKADVRLGYLTQEYADKLKAESDIYKQRGLITQSDVNEILGKNESIGYIIGGVGKRKYDAATTKAKDILDRLDVKKGDDQTEFIERILNVSSSWGSDKNGTIIDFNYGYASGKNKGQSGTIFVFYDGVWYPTGLTRNYHEGYTVLQNDDFYEKLAYEQ
jgi:hypothetical protein